MRILVTITDSSHYEDTGYAQAWLDALAGQGCEAERMAVIPPAWAAAGVPVAAWDLAIAHVLVEEVAAFSETMQLAAALETAGVPLLNPLSSIVVSADKLATHAVWAAAGIPQPRTLPLEAVGRWPAQGRAMVIKPSLGDGARHLQLVEDLDQARAVDAAWRSDEAAGGERRGPALLQDWVPEPACVRLFATPEATSAAYEKARAPGALVTHGTVYPRVYEPPAHMARLARAMVATLGGGLMGVDILREADGTLWALEANAPFGFDVTDSAQRDFVARAAVGTARRRRAGDVSGGARLDAGSRAAGGDRS